MAVSIPEMTSPPAGSAANAPADTALALRWCLRLGGSLALLAAVLFFSAGTLHYWQATVYLLCLLAPLALVSVMLLTERPAVIRRRLDLPGRSRAQKALVRAFRPLFVLVLFVPGLDHRLGLSRTIVGPVPIALTIAGDVALVLAILLMGWVFRLNEFAGRSIVVHEGKRVVSSGPYTLVRHPLDTAVVLLWLATPLALGSWIALPLFALLTPFFVLRLMNEEIQLHRELQGYAAYCKRTPFRLIPLVW